MGVNAKLLTASTTRSNSRARRAPGCIAGDGRRTLNSTVRLAYRTLAFWLLPPGDWLRRPPSADGGQRIADSAFLQVVDERGDRGGAESVVDVDDRDAGRAAVQHSQERRDPAEARAVADARRHRHDRHAHQAGDHARKRAFHPGYDDDDPRRFEAAAFAEQAMQS